MANHVADFAGEVGILTVLGSVERHEAFIPSQLDAKITRHFHTRHGSPTILKRRFIDSDSLNKLLELYAMDDTPIPDALDAAMAEDFTRIADDYDLVIAADFGHTSIGPRLLDALCNGAPFLAVNTQANAGNQGVNTISRYCRADMVFLAEHELRLETRNAYFVLTNGQRGCSMLGPSGGFVKVPAFVTKVVDRVGSGDAFFSVAAMATRLELPEEIIGFLGNAAGGQAVETIGNKKSTSSMTIKKFVTSLMK